MNSVRRRIYFNSKREQLLPSFQFVVASHRVLDKMRKIFVTLLLSVFLATAPARGSRRSLEEELASQDGEPSSQPHSVQEQSNDEADFGQDQGNIADFSQDPDVIDLPGCGDRRPCVADRVIVKFTEESGGIPDDDPRGLEKVRGLGDGGRTAVYTIKGAETPDQAVDRLSRRPDVAWAEPDYVVHSMLTPNDADFASQWGLKKINAPAAWDRWRAGATAAEDVAVGIVDSGIDAAHPDLQGRVASSACFISGSSSTCTANDGSGHGTHVAGIAAAATDNGIGIAGTAYGARIAACRFMDASGSGSNSDAVLCIRHLLSQGVKVLSNSYGCTRCASLAFSDAIADVCGAGGLFVVAAGNANANNDASPSYPSSYSHACVLAVGATTSADARSSFSNYGPTSVDLAAPGTLIYSTFPTSMGGYKTLNGTSMATPFVAGAAGLVWGASGKALSGVGVKKVLMDTADANAEWAGKSVTGGRLNLDAAVARALSAPPPAASVTCTARLHSSANYLGTSWDAVASTADTSFCSQWGPFPAMPLANDVESARIDCTYTGASPPAKPPALRLYRSGMALLAAVPTTCAAGACTGKLNLDRNLRNTNVAAFVCFNGATG